MFQGELLFSSKESLACTNHATLIIEQKMSADKKSMIRTLYIEAQKPYVYDGEIREGDDVCGVIRLIVGEKEDTKYFTGKMLSLSMGLAKIRLDSELTEQNVNEFLKKIERYEFSR